MAKGDTLEEKAEADEEKVKEKADKHDSWDTYKLLGEFHKYTDYKKQSTMRAGQKRAMSTQNEIETEFFKELYGAHKEEKDQPKHKKIKAVTTKDGEKLSDEEVAKKLINRHALRSITKERGAKAAKLYAGNPDQIREYVDAKLGQAGIYDNLIRLLSDSTGEVDEIEQYNQFKTRMAQARVKDFEEFDHIRRHLQDKKHKDGLVEHHEDYVGIQIKKSEEIPSILESLAAYDAGGGKKVTPQYIEQHYKKLKLNKKQEEEYGV